ncbi:MAG: oxidoreductase, partial [Trueperaceae bacterium]
DKAWETTAFREQIDALTETTNLEVVYVLEDPPEEWQGETGFVTAELLARRLPVEKITREDFVCGPPIVMDVVQEALIDLDVPLERSHTERFDLI